MDELCENLNTTYNTNYINKKPKQIQDSFRLIAKTMLPYSKIGNSTMIKLVNNHYEQKKPQAINIAGPMSLTLHTSNKYKKQIYIFGEQHYGELCTGESITLPDYLEQLLLTTDVFIDLYLETALGGIAFLEQLKTKYGYCIRDADISCELFRLHAADIRFKKEGIHVGLITNELVEKIRQMSQEEAEIYFWNRIATSQFNKEMDRSYMGNVILKYMKNLFEDYIRRDYHARFSRLKEYSMEGVKYSMKGIQYAIAVYSSIQMDGYLLARIFKKFKNVKNQPEEPHNIIIYVGDAHAEHYRDFLKKLGFKEHKHKTQLLYERCLHLQKFPQPFFNKLWY